MPALQLIYIFQTGIKLSLETNVCLKNHPAAYHENHRHHRRHEP
ncbi:hypothetical protein HMPREF9370_0748 [Neisseria wadsworthii 9715]|uniref:Uncharacterized protein n=1 Tax=Neisseria wadsworthii 9715 TaxID=1030841 RepID=G4CNT9_9NEIS|nr:hypothetical protein HMPREF9370_0748 [Neisseria wadsworthii 9715]